MRKNLNKQIFIIRRPIPTTQKQPLAGKLTHLIRWYISTQSRAKRRNKTQSY